MRRLFAIIVAAIAFIGCSMDDITVSYQTDKSDIYYASFEDFGDESRTYVDENVKLLWHEDDRISLFRTTLNEQFKFTGATGDNSGGFSAIPSDEWVTGSDVSTNYAVYPYNATTKLSNDEIIQLTMPAVQQYAENSFGRGANTMVAASESTSSKFLPFRNLGGYIIVKLYGEDTTIKSIEFKGNNEEVIAGAATAEAKYGYLPVIAMSESGTTTITLDCGEEGVTISSDSANPTSFWFVVPPITFEGGFTFTITDINGNTFTKSTTKSQTVVRNGIKSMSAFEPTFDGEVENPETPAGPANNEIWYTATEKVEPYSKTVFGANIVSNEWNSTTGEGVITFDGEVTKIGDTAFNMCYSLNSINIPNSVVEIEGQPFYDCSNIEAFYGKFASTDNRCLIINGVLHSFAPAGITEYTIPDNVTEIGSYVFYKCTSLKSVTIPNSVTSIGDRAFIDCSSLKGITIPDSVTEIGEWAFYGCTCLSNITISNNIKTIGEGTFYHCKSLQSIVIPDSVTEIGNDAFDMCFGLTDITIGNSVEIIGEEAFSECTHVTQITIPDSVSIIGNKAFNCCYCLESITFGRGVTIIRSDAFAECNKLSSIHISDLVAWCNVKGGSNVPYNKLYLNNELVTDLVIPDGVEIMYVSFEGYNLLQSVTIPDSVTEFYDYHVFAECKNLKRVVIGAGMTDLSGWTFSDCTNLEEVYCKAVTPPSGSSFFYGCDSGYKIYVPRASLNSYKAATGWSNYADRIVGYDF